LARAATGLALALLGAGQLVAQTSTGKVEGTVRDQAGAPLAGAQVIIVGSAFTATTNESGYYFINNVPAGVMTLRGQYIGYAPAEVRNVRVFAGQTMTVDMTLEQRAIEIGGVTITVEANPLVPRDQVTTKPIVAGDLIDDLPADNVAQVLALQPGVVAGGRGLTVRGGRPGETATYIDGVPVRNYSGGFNRADGGVRSGVEVGTNALEEASVTTGAIGAEFGEAQAGVISLVTRSGGQNYSGSISYSTDEISGQTYGQGLHRLEASFSGPLRIVPNLTFSLSTTLEGQQTPRLGKGWEDVPIYVMSGLDRTHDVFDDAQDGYVTVPLEPENPASDSARVALPAFTRYSDGARRPDDNEDHYTFSAKLNYTFGQGSRVSATFLQSRDQNLFFRFNDLYNTQAQRGNRQLSRALILNWTQNLTRASENALFLEASASWQRDVFISGLLAPGWLEEHRDPFAWFNFSNLEFLVDFDNFPVDDRLVQNIRLGNCLEPRDIGGGNTAGGCVPFLLRSDLDYVASYRFNPYGVTPGTSYFTTGGYGDNAPTLSQETRLTARVNLDWQANRYNRLRFGGEFLRISMSNFTGDLLETFTLDAYRETPIRMGLFAQNRIDLGDVVIELGGRYDRIDSGILYSNYVARVYNDPMRTGDLREARTAQDTLVAQRCGDILARMSGPSATPADTTAYSTCNMFEAPSHSAVSPTLRVSFPITDRTGFRLSYSHQVQTPDFATMARRANGDASYTNTNATYGRDLDFGKTIAFEFGIRHAFSDDMVLDVSAYNRDKVSDIAARVLPFFDPFEDRVINYNVFGNFDFGNVRGIDLKLDRRIGSLFQGSIAYTLQAARTTGSDPLEYLQLLARQISSITNDRSPPPQALLASRDDRTHTIAGNATLRFPSDWRSGTTAGMLLRDVGLFATFRFASGLPYTRLRNDGTGLPGPAYFTALGANPIEPINSSRTPWIRNVDLRVTKGLTVAGRSLTLFADFRNLFNFTNVLQVFAETGDLFNEVWENKAISPVISNLESEAGNLVVTRTVRGQSLRGVDLSDCGAYDYAEGGLAGVPNCIMLRGVEDRFSITDDDFFDEEEQLRAFREWYSLFNGPQNFRDVGFNLRIGFELNF
jgi:hypothetical protein